MHQTILSVAFVLLLLFNGKNTFYSVTVLQHSVKQKLYPKFTHFFILSDYVPK